MSLRVAVLFVILLVAWPVAGQVEETETPKPLAAEATPDEATPEVTPEAAVDVDITSKIAEAYFTGSPDTSLLGEPLTLTLSIEIPLEGVKIIAWPEFEDEWGPFVIRETGPLLEITEADRRTYQQTLTVIIWQPGIYKTPDTTIAYQIGEQDVFNLPVLPFSYTVKSVLDGFDFDLRPFKPVIALLFISPLIIIGGGTGIIYGIRRWREYRSRVTPVPPVVYTPAQIAIAELQRLSKENLSAAELYMRVADCLRAYIHAELEVPAQDMTTAEVMDALEAVNLGERLQRELHLLLEHADLVKFANARPGDSARKRLLQVARGWIEHVEAVRHPLVVEEASAS